MSLYRTYRPQQFTDVVGQEHVVTTLNHAVEQDKLAHAYLFAGPRGTGKTSVARILAKTLLTRGVQDAALKQQITEAVEDDSIVDLTEIDAASNRGIDDIRSLLEKIQFTPVVAAAKVYIIDEVHMLTREAFNALLKTLEEPPAYAYFILATTELHKIPATIQSRCQRFLFRQIREDDLVGRMRFIAEKENITVADDALRAIAHHVHGGMRDAISLLDQLRSLPSIALQDVKERVGETGHEYVEHIRTALAAHDKKAIMQTIRKLEETGVPLENFLRLLLDDVRLDLHKHIDEGKAITHLEPLLDVLLQAIKNVRSAPVPGLVVEATLLSLCTNAAPEPATAPPANTAPAVPPPATPAKESATPPPSATIAAKEPTPPAPATTAQPDGTLTLEHVRSLWKEAAEAVQPASAQMSLRNGQLHALESDTIVIRFSSSFHRDKASNTESMRPLEKRLSDALGKPVKVRYVLESEVHAPPIAQEENVDLAAAALDVF